MKTPEELAEEYCASPHEKDAFLTGHKIGFAEGRAGYEAAQEQQLDLPETIAVGKWVYKLVKES